MATQEEIKDFTKALKTFSEKLYEMGDWIQDSMSTIFKSELEEPEPVELRTGYDSHDKLVFGEVYLYSASLNIGPKVEALPFLFNSEFAIEILAVDDRDVLGWMTIPIDPLNHYYSLIEYWLFDNQYTRNRKKVSRQEFFDAIVYDYKQVLGMFSIDYAGDMFMTELSLEVEED